MNRCPTVLLTCGWFLFTAPLAPDGKVRTGSPLSEWSHEKSFDTAKECETYKEEVNQNLKALREWAKQQNMPLHTHEYWRIAAPRAYGRCISSDAVKVK
jgi:hypothetical protein